MSASLTSVLVLMALAAGGAASIALKDAPNPDCPDGVGGGDLDPDHPCAHLASRSYTPTGAPELPTLQPGETRTFECLRWAGCVWFHVATPAGGERTLHVTVEAEEAGGFSARAGLAEDEPFLPRWADGVYHEAGSINTWTFEAPFDATAWVLEFTSMQENGGGEVAVTVAFA